MEFLQKDGDKMAISVKISRRPASMRTDITHIPDGGRKSYEPVTPVTPAPRPLFDIQDTDEKKASTIGKPCATRTTPPKIISSV